MWVGVMMENKRTSVSGLYGFYAEGNGLSL